MHYAATHFLGGKIVRAAIEDAAEVFAIVVDAADEQAQPGAEARWRRRFRSAVASDGHGIRNGEWKGILGDFGDAAAKIDVARMEMGVAVARTGDEGYEIRNAAGERMLRLPRQMGANVLSDPKQFAGRMRLFRVAMNAADPGDLWERALHIFGRIADRDHKLGTPHLLYGARSVEARTDAFVTSVRQLRAAKTEEERLAAEATAQTVLFAEAAPLRKLIATGLDFTPGPGNVNSFGDARKEFFKMVDAIEPGEADDALTAGFWTAINGVAAGLGLPFGKIAKAAANVTPGVKRYAGAYDLAHFQDLAKQTGHRAFKAEEMMLPRYWKVLSPYQKTYLEGTFSNANGAAGEAIQQERSVAAGFPSFEAEEVKQIKRGGARTLVRLKPHSVQMRPEHGGRLRKFDDGFVGVIMKRIMDRFLFPDNSPGKITVIENKGVGAKKSIEQRLDERSINASIHLDSKKYEIESLQIPYLNMNKNLIQKK